MSFREKQKCFSILVTFLVFMYLCVRVRARVCVYVCMHYIGKHACSMCMCMNIYIYIVYICVYIYM